MTMKKVCPIYLYIQTISSGGETDKKYVRLIGVNGRQCKRKIIRIGSEVCPVNR